MAEQSFPNSGSMFVRDKKSPKAADYGGDFTLSGDVLDYIIRKYENGEEVKLEVGGWKRMGRNNTTFISLNIQTPYSERGGNNAPNQLQGRSGYSNGGGRPAPQQRQQYVNPANQQQRGSYAGNSMEARGNYQQRPPQDRPQQRAPQRDMRQDLDDDIPFFGNDGGNNSTPWE